MEYDGEQFLDQAPSTVTSNGVRISIWNAATIGALPRPQQARLREIVNVYGLLSGKAQGLPAAVTDLDRLQLHGHVLYMAHQTTGSRTMILGGLKIGVKKLFLHSPRCDKYLEINPDCVLDFYVHESCQRSGIGLALLEAFLRDSGKTAAMLAYDRPSPKLKAFLAKHYGLANFLPQNNNYVVYNEFFNTAAAQQQQQPARRVVQADMPRGIPCLQLASPAVQLEARASSAPGPMCLPPLPAKATAASRYAGGHQPAPGSPSNSCDSSSTNHGMERGITSTGMRSSHLESAASSPDLRARHATASTAVSSAPQQPRLSAAQLAALQQQRLIEAAAQRRSVLQPTAQQALAEASPYAARQTRPDMPPAGVPTFRYYQAPPSQPASPRVEAQQSIRSASSPALGLSPTRRIHISATMPPTGMPLTPLSNLGMAESPPSPPPSRTWIGMACASPEAQAQSRLGTSPHATALAGSPSKGGLLRTPWALHDAQDEKEAAHARLMPARKVDISVRASPASPGAAKPPFRVSRSPRKRSAQHSQ